MGGPRLPMFTSLGVCVCVCVCDSAAAKSNLVCASRLVLKPAIDMECLSDDPLTQSEVAKLNTMLKSNALDCITAGWHTLYRQQTFDSNNTIILANMDIPKSSAIFLYLPSQGRISLNVYHAVLSLCHNDRSHCFIS